MELASAGVEDHYHMSVKMSEKISVVGVGKYRKTAENAAVKLEGTPFHFAAMLDVTGPEAYRFTPDRLRLVLHALNPVPRCFIAGEGIDEKDNIAAIEVWKEFVEERKPEHPLMLNVSDTCY